MSWVHRRHRAGHHQSGRLPERPPGRAATPGRTALVGGLAALLTGTMLAVTAAPAHAAGESDFQVDKHDLEFILKQITISENHAKSIREGNGDTLLCDSPDDQSGTCVPDPMLPWGLRTVDGSYNNITTPERKNYGAGLQTFPRLLEPDFQDAEDISYDFDGPGPVQAGTPTSYKQRKGFVWDSEPRIVSNLIADQTVDNPAAKQAQVELAELGAKEYDHDGDPQTPASVFLPNVSADEGLSAPFNSWFTLFGQFFDHGLDMVSKGGNGTVVVPLTPDDPLMAQSGRTPFLMLTRATNLPGPDGILGTDDDVQEHTNRTTPFVDQNQTYTSHPSHQVFLREYAMEDHDGDGATAEVPVPTGRLLNGEGGEGLTTWADVKEQARTKLGIELDDQDVHNVPLLATDPYGRFIAGANGFPQLVVPGADGAENTLLEGDPTAPVDASQALKAGHAFLDDIGHNAVPTTSSQGRTVALNPDSDAVYNPVDQPLSEVGTYDDELLDAHFITGDGRGNENIGLSAVHHVFHAEHNRLVGQIEQVIADSGDQAFIDQWRAESGPWDYGERIFQAARYVTEMQYQHLVFEEFARKIQPTIDGGPLNETLYHADIDPAVTAEFAHVVYRFGHSMLTDTVARDGYETQGVDDLPLLDAFLNPAEFAPGGLTADQGAAAVIQGMMNQTGNGIDEFVVDTLRNNLLGLPLDLATINMARARDAGIPSLQAARRTFYDATADSSVKPYANWLDFQLAMRHRSSLVNFIAAYGTDPTITSITPDTAGFIAARREAAQAIVDTMGTANEHPLLTAPAAQSGLDDVDFWIGGLAERPMIFGGMLGPTFNKVFEEHLENLQNGDRFYYLNRNQGLNLFHQLEASSFADLVMRNTDAKNLPVDIFARQDLTVDLAALPDPLPAGLRQVAGAWRWDGPEHITMHGTDAADNMFGGDGDDALWGHGGDDRIEGGVGNDGFHGGLGNDVLTDIFGDDTIHGGPGDDAINAGPGFDLVFGQSGNDFLLHGQEPTRSFAGAGDDFVMGGDAGDVIGGDQGTDWLEGGTGADLLQGDLALTFQSDPYGGPDVFIGGPGNDDHDAEGGDDIMLNQGTDRHAGMLGFDWVTHKGNPDPVDVDMNLRTFLPLPVVTMRSRYLNVEGLSGWDGDDILRARSKPGDPAFVGGAGHELTQEQLDRVAGLRALLGGGDMPEYASLFMGPEVTAEDADANDLVLGGGGNDLIEGRGGDDFIDGDAALDVWLVGPDGERGENMAHFRSRIFDGSMTASDLRIQRAVVNQGAADDVDTVYYDDVRASFAEPVAIAPGIFQVQHLAPAAVDLGTDILRNIERVQFSDGTVIDLTTLVEDQVTGSITLSRTDAVEGQELSFLAQLPGVDAAGVTYTWQAEDGAGGWQAVGASNSPTFTPDDSEVGKRLRVVANFGEAGTDTVTSNETEPVVNVNDAPTGPVLSTDLPLVGSTITAGELVDADGLPTGDAAPQYQWQQGSAGAWSDIDGATAETFMVTAAQAGDQLRVVAGYTDLHGTDETATSAASQPVEEVTVPGAPSVTAGAGDAAGTLLVQWTPSTDTGNTALTGFELQVLDGTQVVQTADSIAASDRQLQVNGLTAGGTFTVQVRAINSVGASPWSAPADATAGSAPAGPTVLSSTPADGDTDVSVAANVAVFFSEPIEGYQGAAVTLTDTATDTEVPFTRGLNAENRLLLNPFGDEADQLQPGTEYRVTLTGGADAIRAADDGTPFASTSFTFTTVAASTTVPTVLSTSPAAGATGVPVDGNVAVFFSEAVVGYDGTNVTLKKAADGTEVPFTRGLNADNRLLLNPFGSDAGQLEAGTEYELTLTGGATGIQSVSGVPIETTTITFTTAAASTGGGGTGGTGDTGTGGTGDGGTTDGGTGDGGTTDGGTGGGTTDGAAFSITSTLPAAGDTNVTRTAAVSMSITGGAQQVDDQTVSLLRPNGSRIPATVSYDAGSGEISVTPLGMLPNNRMVRVVLDGVRDADGTAVPRTVWRFRTADEVKPRIVKARPVKQDAIRPGANIRMWTNERVRGVNRKAVVLREVGGKRVAATVVYRAKQRKLVINPRQRLDRNTRYVVVVRPMVRDLAGNRLARTVWRFRTR